MNLRAVYFPLCAFLFVASGAQAAIYSAVDASTTLSSRGVSGGSPIVRETQVIDRVKEESRIAAHIEVSFSGAQQERFVFEERGRSITQEKGVDLRTVGTFAIESGARKMSVAVLREVRKPDVFHARLLTSTGGKLSAVVTLQVNSETTLVIPGGKPTTVTIKRLR